MIYLVSFIISGLFAYFASRVNNRLKFVALSFFSIAILVVLAGLRDYNIGIDVMGYLTKEPYWAGAISSDSIFEYLKTHFKLGFGEPLFAVLLGLIAQFIGKYRVFLFVAHAIILTCIYIGTFRLKKYINPTFVLLVYYLLYYNHTLNIIRQHIAMAILFVAFADLLNGKYIKYCIFVFIAMLFHSTAIISLGLLAVHLILNFQHKKLEKFSPIHRKYSIVLGLTWIVFLFAPLVKILVSLGILNKRYLFFLKNTTEPAIIVSGMVFLGLIAAYYFREQMKQKCEQYDFFVMCSICYLILLQLAFTVAHGKRVALYFALSDILTLGLIESSQTNKKTRRLVRIVILGICFIYWFYIYVWSNAGKTFPYILGL